MLPEIGNHTAEDELNATYGWIEERPQVIQGTIFSMWCYSTNASLVEPSWRNLSDKDLLAAVINKCCSIGSTAGDLSSRWRAQEKIANDILDGKCTDQELETFVRTGQVPSGFSW